ncbi:hypothetical protein N7454_002437 [Penicillium verhagenii]|nr:hypothetical protein N7454_002437 [Penicillium verhagenii]
MPLLHMGIPALLVCLLVLLPQVHAFGAGNIASISAVEGKNWRHGDIEDVLKTIACIAGHKWTSTMIKRVYFGNWLRDYSQAMDVGTLKNLQAETIRILVWVLSFLSFGYATGEFEVTSERLGVYRPEEHIDNPKDYADNEDARQYDERLRGPVRQVELDIDMDTGMKNYIANERGDWATSAAYVKYSLRRSIHYGRTYTHGGERKNNEDDLCEALRCLGQSLHTLEDFAAHTNYCELALREMGFHNIFTHWNGDTDQCPWASDLPATDHFTQSEVNEMDIALGDAENSAHSNNSLNALTGLLGKVPGTRDLVHEAEHLRQLSDAQEVTNRSRGSHMGYAQTGDFRGVDEQSRAGGASPGPGLQDKVVRKLNSIIEKVPGLEAIIEKITETLTVFIMSLLAPFVRPLINAASKSLQTGSSGVVEASGKHQFEPWTDPHCTDPTHSLLSKDHFANILNEPAGQVASAIVKYVGPRVLYAWQHIDVAEDEVVEDCMRIFHHPVFRDMNNEAHRTMFEAVQTWVHSRPDRGANLNDVLSSGGSEQAVTPEAFRTLTAVVVVDSLRLALMVMVTQHSSQQHSSSQQSHASSGLPWDKLSHLPIPGMSNLNKLESTISNFLPGGLSHGSRGLDENEAENGAASHQGQQQYGQNSNGQSGYHGRYQ